MTKSIFRYLIVASFVFAFLSGIFDTLFTSALPEVLSKALATYNEEFITKYKLLDYSLFALYLISYCAANAGLLLFKPWSLPLAVIVTLAGFVMQILAGPVVHSGWAASLSDISTTCWLLVLFSAYFSPVRQYFVKDIPLQSPDIQVKEVVPVLEVSAPALTINKSQPLIANIRAGLRALFFVRVQLDENNATWSQLVLILFISLVIQFLGNFAQVGLNGEFSLYGLPGALFGFPVILLTAWALAKLVNQPNKTLLLIVIFCVIYLPFEAIQLLLRWSYNQRSVRFLGYQGYEFINLALITWFALACAVVSIRTLGMTIQKRIFSVFLALILIGLPTSKIYRDQELWVKPYDRNEAIERNRKQNLLANEDIFYLQPQLLERELAAVTPSHKHGIDLYFVGAAGYSTEDVFMKEVEFVDNLFKQRYGTDGHSVMLINNPGTVKQLPIASATSLRLTLNRVSAMMDQKKDILFLYLTSHGSTDHKLALEFGTMKFNELDPKQLREILDASGIKRRIIVISACYSGGFIEALKNENSLIITSSAPDKTSFGCSNEAVFTYFGKAYFEEALHKTDSFIDAYELALTTISHREKADGYTPSDPKIYIGEAIKHTLADFQRQQTSMHIVKEVTATSLTDSSLTFKHEQQDTNSLRKTTINNQLQNAQRLVTQLKYKDMLQDSIKQCKETASMQSPEDLVKTDPNYFKGITPQSQLWPKVVETYHDYYTETCNYLNIDTYLSSMAGVYSSTLSANELSTTIKFYSSPTGRKLATTNLGANAALQKEMYREMSATSEKADANFKRKISAIAESNKQLNKADQNKKESSWKFWQSK